MKDMTDKPPADLLSDAHRAVARVIIACEDTGQVGPPGIYALLDEAHAAIDRAVEGAAMAAPEALANFLLEIKSARDAEWREAAKAECAILTIVGSSCDMAIGVKCPACRTVERMEGKA